MYQFTCNVCKSRCRAATLEREPASCDSCGSNVRVRWLIHGLSMELFGRSLALPDFPVRRDIRGLGMSDPVSIATVLEGRFGYWNSCFHREPLFDITTTLRAQDEAAYDFVISSEVFEHVRPPVQVAFDHLARLLKPGGFVVFSAPWEAEGETVEHFPALFDWRVVQLDSGFVLVNRTAEGRLETFEDLNFHGGPGSTLEMRVFSRDGLWENFRAAGFDSVEIAEDCAAFGIVWEPWARGMILRRRRQDWNK